MTDTYAPRHLAPVEPGLVVLCHPGLVATHQPFATRADAQRWINDEHRHGDHCALDHRVIPAAALDGIVDPDPGCGRGRGCVLSPVEDLPGGGKAMECIEHGNEVVIEPDDSRVPVDVYEVQL